MDILSCKINAFLAIGEADIKLSEKGLVLLQGENRDDTSQDSNGAGKSTIADALSWCLYGITARGESGDDVLNRSYKAGCVVETILKDGDNLWRVQRHRKHKANKNRLLLSTRKVDSEMIEWEDRTSGTDKATQEILTKIIGCSKEVFCAAIYAGQENLVDLPSMTDKALKVIVEEAAGIDRLQLGYKIATGNVSRAKTKLATAMTDVDAKRNSLAIIEDNLDSTQKASDAWNAERDEDMKAALIKKESLEGESSKVEEKDYSEEIAAIDAKIGKFNAAIDAAARAERESAVAENNLSNAMIQIKRDKVTLAELKEGIELAESHLASAKDTLEVMACDECGQEIVDDEARAKHIAAHEKKVSAARKKHMHAESELKSSAMKARELKSTLVSAQSKLTDVSKYKNAVTKLTDAKMRLVSESSVSANLKDKIKEQLNLFKKLRDATNPHAKILAKLTEQKEALDKELAELVDSLVEKYEYDLLVAEGAAKVFSPSGVRAHLLDQVTPYLNDRTSHYLSILSDGNITAVWTTLTADSKGTLKEKFSIEVESTTGGKSFRSLSGGEKRKVRLATYLALQDLVSSRASKPINLLIADEIDQAIDKSGLERLMTVLIEKAKERGTAIVISHTDLKSWIANSVTIVKEGGKSRIEGTALS